MVKYLAYRIISGELEYNFVINKRPDLKDDIDKVIGNFYKN